MPPPFAQGRLWGAAGTYGVLFQGVGAIHESPLRIRCAVGTREVGSRGVIFQSGGAEVRKTIPPSGTSSQTPPFAQGRLAGSAGTDGVLFRRGGVYGEADGSLRAACRARRRKLQCTRSCVNAPARFLRCSSFSQSGLPACECCPSDRSSFLLANYSSKVAACTQLWRVPAEQVSRAGRGPHGAA